MILFTIANSLWEALECWLELRGYTSCRLIALLFATVLQISESDYLEVAFPSNSKITTWNYLINLCLLETAGFQLF